MNTCYREEALSSLGRHDMKLDEVANLSHQTLNMDRSLCIRAFLHCF